MTETAKNESPKNGKKSAATANDGWETHRPTRAMKDGETVEGYYLGATEIVGRWGPRNVHHFHGADGVTFSIYGGAVADKLLSGAPKGIMTRLTRVGNIEDSQAVEYQMQTNQRMQAPNNISSMFVGS